MHKSGGGGSVLYGGAVCGMDISAKELVVMVRRGEKAEPVRRFANTAPGHQELQRYLTSPGTRVRVCMESTGLYGLDVALRLRSDVFVEIMVANPRSVKDFSRALPDSCAHAAVRDGEEPTARGLGDGDHAARDCAGSAAECSESGKRRRGQAIRSISM